jgi:hypothetical protein
MTISWTENQVTQGELLTDPAELRRYVDLAVNTTPVIDVHTHIFPPEFDQLCLFGIDELLTYHYLIAETFRSVDVSPSRFWRMSRPEQADLIWKTLFVDNTPISEATRGIVSVLSAFDLDPRAVDLSEARNFFRSQNLREHIDRVLDLANVDGLVMTNDPFDEHETRFWKQGSKPDSRFLASLRMDGLLNSWPNAVERLAGQGYAVDAGLGEKTVGELRRFLEDWIAIMKPVYMAVSLPDDFTFPHDGFRDRLIREVVLPAARDEGIALALMIGVRRGVNPALRSAGDGVGRADVSALERMCAANPGVRFLATFLSRENQHELCVAARKFGNLLPFGCWWFLNNPSLVSEITLERLELLGPTFIPQHSDARVLEQLVYKWRHSRETIADSLAVTYERLLASGRAVTPREITRDVARMFSGNFRGWVGLSEDGAGQQ